MKTMTNDGLVTNKFIVSSGCNAFTIITFQPRTVENSKTYFLITESCFEITN